MIERTEGCPHMRCTCGHQFCYTCGASYVNNRKACGCDIFVVPIRNQAQDAAPRHVRGAIIEQELGIVLDQLRAAVHGQWWAADLDHNLAILRAEIQTAAREELCGAYLHQELATTPFRLWAEVVCRLLHTPVRRVGDS